MKKSDNLEFFCLTLVAFLLSYVPFIQIPFTWFMTFFHEISHGIGALCTGGSIHKIEIHLQGSGLCYTSGGIRFVVLNAGYIGAVLWGVVIFVMADGMSRKGTNFLVMFFAGFIAISGILYGRDLFTWIILLFLIGVFISIVKLHGTYLMSLSLKFIGLYVLLDAVRAPLHLIDGNHCGDGAALSDLTLIPEIIWVALWLIIGFCGVFYLWKRSNKQV